MGFGGQALSWTGVCHGVWWSSIKLDGCLSWGLVVKYQVGRVSVMGFSGQASNWMGVCGGV